MKAINLEVHILCKLLQTMHKNINCERFNFGRKPSNLNQLLVIVSEMPILDLSLSPGLETYFSDSDEKMNTERRIKDLI